MSAPLALPGTQFLDDPYKRFSCLLFLGNLPILPTRHLKIQKALRQIPPEIALIISEYAYFSSHPPQGFIASVKPHIPTLPIVQREITYRGHNCVATSDGWTTICAFSRRKTEEVVLLGGRLVNLIRVAREVLIYVEYPIRGTEIAPRGLRILSYSFEQGMVTSVTGIQQPDDEDIPD